MAYIRMSSTIGELAGDCRAIAVRAPRDMRTVVQKNLRAGNTLARANAERTSGNHGKLYPRAFSFEMTGATSGEYGPDAGKPQGGMSFEGGSRNQPPHNDVAKSHDVIAPKFDRDVSALPDKWFWP